MPPFYTKLLGRSPSQKSGLYFKLEGGDSFADKVAIVAPPAEWDISREGYDGSFNPTAYGSLAVGMEFDPLISSDLSFSYRPRYKYRKFQTSTSTLTPGFLGTKTREFDLDIATLMFTTYLSGQGIDELCWSVGNCSAVYPFVGGGIGVNRWNIYNFRSTGIPPVNGVESFGSDNPYDVTYSLSYQAIGGLELRSGNDWALSVGYRWFGADTFHGPRFIRDPLGRAIDLKKNSWKIKFEANEVFIALKIYV